MSFSIYSQNAVIFLGILSHGLPYGGYGTVPQEIDVQIVKQLMQQDHRVRTFLLPDLLHAENHPVKICFQALSLHITFKSFQCLQMVFQAVFIMIAQRKPLSALICHLHVSSDQDIAGLKEIIPRHGIRIL